MKLKDVLHISTKNIRIYLKRNLLIMAVMGIIFGLVLTINLWFQGMVNCYMELANRTTGGKVIIEATNSTAGMVIDEEQPQATRQEMIADIEAYGGKVLGEAEKFGAFGGIVLPEDIVKNAIEVDLAKVPTDAAPVLVSSFLGEQLLGKNFPAESTSAIKKQKDYEEFRNSLIGKTFTDTQGAKYYVVGLTPGSFHVHNLSLQQLEKNNHNLLNSVLRFISTPAGTPIIVDNGESATWQTRDNALNDVSLSAISDKSDSIAAFFDNNQTAYVYFKNGQGQFADTAFSNRTYSVDVIAGTSPEVQYIINILQTVINIISATLGLIATIIVIFTTIRLTDQDKSTIALYYSLGATAKQIHSIYLCYFFMLMLETALFAFSLASVIVLTFSFLNQELLHIQAAVGFSQTSAPQIIFYATNITVLITIIYMLLMAPLCTLINHKRLSTATFKKA